MVRRRRGHARHRHAGERTRPTPRRFRAGAPPATGTGLAGTYYDNLDFTGPALARIDPTVNFDWGTGSPAPAIGADTFSARWTGQVQRQVTETYTFYTQSDDGVRLWVNGTLLVNNWTDHSPTENTGTIALTAGQRYDIRMDVYESSGNALARLSWSAPGLAKEVVPQTSLYPYALLITGTASLQAGDNAVRKRLRGVRLRPGDPDRARRHRRRRGRQGGRPDLLVDRGDGLRDQIPQHDRPRRRLGAAPPRRPRAHRPGRKHRLRDRRQPDADRHPETGSPLAAGLTGRVAVTTAASSFTWGRPGAGAVVVARQVGTTGHATVFGYERGAAMVGLTAPARRVGLFLSDSTPSRLTSQGWTLFDAAVRWASGRP